MYDIFIDSILKKKSESLFIGNNNDFFFIYYFFNLSILDWDLLRSESFFKGFIVLYKNKDLSFSFFKKINILEKLHSSLIISYPFEKIVFSNIVFKILYRSFFFFKNKIVFNYFFYLGSLYDSLFLNRIDIKSKYVCLSMLTNFLYKKLVNENVMFMYYIYYYIFIYIYYLFLLYGSITKLLIYKIVTVV